MTSTTLNNGVTVGGATGTGAGAIKTSLQGTTTAYTVACLLTNGAAAGNPTHCVKFFAVTSPYSITATQAVTQLRQAASFIDIIPHADPGGSTIQDFPLLARKGDFVYTWFEDGTFNPTKTLTSTLYEIN